MGNYSYLCNDCGLSIRGGEKAVLRHVRHGQVLGEARGAYDGYGGVDEDNLFSDGTGDDWSSSDDSAIFAGGKGVSAQPNSHRQIWLSQFSFEDSDGFISGARVLNGKPLTWMGFRAAAPSLGLKDLSPEMYAKWETLTPYRETHKEAPRSGVEAWHARCFDRAGDEAKKAHVISKGDPDQSWGKPRQKYI